MLDFDMSHSRHEVGIMETTHHCDGIRDLSFLDNILVLSPQLSSPSPPSDTKAYPFLRKYDFI